jgi:hypothetical protein
MIITKSNENELITIEYSKGNERSYQSVKRRQYITLKLKLEAIGYAIKIIEKTTIK